MRSISHICCYRAVASNEPPQAHNCTHYVKGYDVCGLRYTQVPHSHLPGNMWWANCSYVGRLYASSKFQSAMKYVAGHKDVYGPHGSLRSHVIGEGRYADEHWIGSHPSLRAIDCMPLQDVQDKKFFPYIAGYNMPQTHWPIRCQESLSSNDMQYYLKDSNYKVVVKRAGGLKNLKRLKLQEGAILYKPASNETWHSFRKCGVSLCKMYGVSAVRDFRFNGIRIFQNMCNISCPDPM